MRANGCTGPRPTRHVSGRPWRRPPNPATFRARPTPATIVPSGPVDQDAPGQRLLPQAESPLSPHRARGGVLPVRRRWAAVSGRLRGAFVANLGHGEREIAAAMAEQAGESAISTGPPYPRSVEQLGAEIAALMPAGLDLVYPLCSGSEAVEAALKLARQFWVESGRPAKRKLLALTPSYHGNTLLALSASGRPHYSATFRDWLVEVVRVPAPYPYRCECHGAPPLCPGCSGDALEAALIAAGPDTVAAFIAEPVGGSSTGLPCHPGLLETGPPALRPLRGAVGGR